MQYCKSHDFILEPVISSQPRDYQKVPASTLRSQNLVSIENIILSYPQIPSGSKAEPQDATFNILWEKDFFLMYLKIEFLFYCLPSSMKVYLPPENTDLRKHILKYRKHFCFPKANSDSFLFPPQFFIRQHSGTHRQRYLETALNTYTF